MKKLHTFLFLVFNFLFFSFLNAQNWSDYIQAGSVEDTVHFIYPFSFHTEIFTYTYPWEWMTNDSTCNPVVLNTLGVSITTQNILCNGENNGTAIAQASNGVSPYTYLWNPGGQTTTSIQNLSAGTYTIYVTAQNGDTASAMATITQPSPLINIADGYGFSDTACNGVAYAPASGGVGPYRYLWATGQTTDTINKLCTGNYCCRVTDRNGCVDSACINIPTGVSNITSNISRASVYPNPGTGMFRLEIENYDLRINATVEVYNILGAKVWSDYQITNPDRYGESNYQIDLSSQPNGIYFYHVLEENGLIIAEGKLIIQK